MEKVRINPGNYADRKKFELYDYTDKDYQNELDRIKELVEICGDKINIRLNSNIIIELFGGQGGVGGNAGSPSGCTHGSSGTSGNSIIHPYWIISHDSSTVSSGGPSMTINW